MSVWNKKNISKSEVEELQHRYDVDPITASIMVRRNLVSGRDIMYYREDDLRFQHSPFSFAAMEDVVDRILSARDEHEKVLIFGDRDVDGVSATTVLYECLSTMGLDVRFRLPKGDDAYGLSTTAVEEFAADYGSLVITVDCGISNNAEIALAAEKGLDVIVVDHHNPPAELPQPALIIDPKLEDSGYPFKDISGCAVVYKLVSALRFSQTEWYKQEITLLNVRPLNEAFTVECIKTRNLVPIKRLDISVAPGLSVTQTALPSFLQGQLIFVWDGETTARLLEQVFGKGVDFNCFDVRPEVAKLMPQLAGLSLLRVKDLSKFAKYGDHPATEIGGFYNIFVTYIQQRVKQLFPNLAHEEERDMQLVALAALADIMPMKDENRLFVKQGLSSINAGRIRTGLLELMSHLNLLSRRVTSSDLSWLVVSHLNAAGRLGHAELAADLFLSNDAAHRDSVAARIIDLNTERKKLSADAWNYAHIQAEASIPLHHNKLCVVIDERINRGVSGILAGRLVSTYDVPAMAVTFVDDTAIGSMRSCRDYDVTALLDTLSPLFLNHGGHNFAAGFSFQRERLAEFKARVQELSATIELSASRSNTFEIDAEVPAPYLTAQLLDVCDAFEPCGEENPPILFMSRSLPVLDAVVMGKGEKQHLKLTLGTGKTKWPALFWNKAELLHREVEVGDKIDVLYHVERNMFNGAETPQLVLLDLKRS